MEELLEKKLQTISNNMQKVQVLAEDKVADISNEHERRKSQLATVSIQIIINYERCEAIHSFNTG